MEVTGRTKLRVYEPTPSEDTDWIVQPEESENLEFDGRKFVRWIPPKLSRMDIDEETGTRLRRLDFPWFSSSAIAMRERARQCLESELSGCGQFLDVAVPQDRMWLFNPTSVVDALDESASQLVRFQSSGRIMEIIRYSFRPERLGGLRLFRLSQLPTQILATQVLVDLVERFGLKGIDFRLRWEAP